MKQHMLAATTVVALLFLLTLGASRASADIFVQPPISSMHFDLTSDHCTGAGGCGTPPFGQVLLVQNGANVDIDVTLFNGNKFVKTGSADFQNFKFNGVGVALSDIT